MIIKNKYPYILSAILLVLTFSLVFVTPAFALDLSQPACGGSNSAPCKATGDDIGTLIGSVISMLLFVAGAIAALVIVIGGIRYITSDGDPGATNKAKNTIVYALVGLVVAVMSYAIVNFVIERL